jgi:hypothetical protein
VSWRRRLAPPLLGAGVASAIAAIVGGLTNPYAEKANEAYRHGLQTGLVIRYAVLGGLFTWLCDVLIRSVRRHGSLQAALADRNSRGALPAIGLLAAVLLAIVPPVISSYDGGDALRDRRAGFIDGCSRSAAREDCTCLWNRLVEDPAADSPEELDALTDEADRTGVAPPVLQRAVDRC